MKYLPDAANKPKIKLHFYTKYIALLIDEILYCIKEIAGHILMCALVKHTRIPFSKTVNFLCLCTFFLFLSVFALFSGFSSFSFSFSPSLKKFHLCCYALECGLDRQYIYRATITSKIYWVFTCFHRIS